MKKEYRPMALDFWGVGLPLAVFGILFCETRAQRVTVEEEVSLALKQAEADPLPGEDLLGADDIFAPSPAGR